MNKEVEKLLGRAAKKAADKWYSTSSPECWLEIAKAILNDDALALIDREWAGFTDNYGKEWRPVINLTEELKEAECYIREQHKLVN